MKRRKAVAVLLGLALLSAPFLYGIFQTEAELDARFERLGAPLPADTTELMGFFSIETALDACQGTAAKQLGTELDPRQVASFFESQGGLNGRLAVAWFEKQRVMLRESTGGEPHFLSAAEVDALPMAARFLLNVHAFLPEGVRRVVLFSSESIESSLEPRCW